MRRIVTKQRRQRVRRLPPGGDEVEVKDAGTWLSLHGGIVAEIERRERLRRWLRSPGSRKCGLHQPSGQPSDPSVLVDQTCA